MRVRRCASAGELRLHVDLARQRSQYRTLVRDVEQARSLLVVELLYALDLAFDGIDEDR